MLKIYFSDSKAAANKRARVVTAVKRLRPGETPVQNPGCKFKYEFDLIYLIALLNMNF